MTIGFELYCETENLDLLVFIHECLSVIQGVWYEIDDWIAICFFFLGV